MSEENKGNKNTQEEEEVVDLDGLEDEEFKSDTKSGKIPDTKSGKGRERGEEGSSKKNYKEVIGDGEESQNDAETDGYMLGEDKEEIEESDKYLRDLENKSGFTDYKRHKDKHGTYKDTGENFRRDYYDDDYKETKDREQQQKKYGKRSETFDDYMDDRYSKKKTEGNNKPYSLHDEVERYGGKDLEGLDESLKKGTKTGNKNLDRSLDAIRDAVEYDIARAVEKDAERMRNSGMERAPTERDFQRLEDKHKRKKAESLRKRVTTGIKTARTKENKAKFKAFMDSSEVKLALNLIGIFGGVYGKAFVKGVRIFTIIWSLNFGVIFLILMAIVAMLGAIMVSAVFIVILLTDTVTEEEVGEEVEVGEEQTTSRVDVPKGYEGKFMFPVEKTRQSSRGYTGKGGHLGQDISGSNGSENVYPIYPGKVLLSGKGRPQCNNSGGSTCSTLKNESAGIYFSGDGNAVQIAHDIGGGKYLISYYMHLAPNSIKVSEGDSVGYGTPIAKVGNSGNSYGAHLHIELYDNVEKGFFDAGKSHYKTRYDWYYKLIDKTIAPPPLWTCGGKSGVAVNSSGGTTTPQSCVDDAVKARTK